MGISNSKSFFAASCLLLAATSASATTTSSSVVSFAPTTSQRLAFVDPAVWKVRGGESAAVSENETEEEPSLDDKVHAAMRKLGIAPPGEEEDDDGQDNNNLNNCEDGVCEIPKSEESSSSTESLNPHELAATISKDMNVDVSLAMAAIGVTATQSDNGQVYNEQAARAMIQQELDLISNIPEDSENVKTLVEEGYDSFLSRRALAFADDNMDDARAILLADQLDAEEEERLYMEQQEKEDEEAAMREEMAANQNPDMVEVKTNFDPTALPATPAATPSKPQEPQAPTPARKEDVVFEATAEQIQELVLESPVPVLLDIHAEWCGPCKVLGPALEEMAIKSGGLFRVVKVDSDKNKPVSAALEVTALPTVYGVRDGKIVHMFEGMPKSEKMMQNFMMGLFGAAPFSPPVTSEESQKYDELTNKLIKTAGSACFSFSARERLTDRVTTRLGELVADESVADVEGTATLIRTLLNNVVKHPYEQKYRKLNLENKKIAKKIGGNASSLAVLKSVGFSKTGSEMTLGKGKKVINVAPLMVARDTIDTWILRNQKEMAAMARKRKDEADHARLQAEREEASDEEEVEEEVEKVDETVCQLKLRLDGKKKVHEVNFHEDDPLSKVLEALEVDSSEEEVQITCVAKRLVVKSSDDAAMKKTLSEYGLKPKAAIVVKVGNTVKADASSLKERAAEKKSLKTGSHSMHSIGVYAKDDNNKAELVDGGGGTLYEQDVSDDEEEEKPGENEEETAEEPAEGGAEPSQDQQEGEEEE
jgi:thiol-disulfide isomerase/thioredoxin